MRKKYGSNIASGACTESAGRPESPRISCDTETALLVVCARSARSFTDSEEPRNNSETPRTFVSYKGSRIITGKMLDVRKVLSSILQRNVLRKHNGQNMKGAECTLERLQVCYSAEQGHSIRCENVERKREKQ